MSERLYHYSLIRYVPRPVAEEFVNVGVVAVSDSGDEAAVEFTDDWTRARALGGREEDVLMLRRLARAWTDEDYDLPLFHRANGEDDGAARLNRLYENSANKVQFSRPHRGLASSVDDIVDEVFSSLIASAPKVRTSRAPSRAAAVRTRGRGAVASGSRSRGAAKTATRTPATTSRNATRSAASKSSKSAAAKRTTKAPTSRATKHAAGTRTRTARARAGTRSRATGRRPSARTRGR